MKNIRKLAIILSFALIATLFAVIPANAASNGTLVKEVKHISYYKKDGKWQPTKAVCKCTETTGYERNGKETDIKTSFSKSEFKFKYGKTKADKKRCCSMINDIVANTYADNYGNTIAYAGQ